MKILSLSTFVDTPDFHNVIDAINDASSEDKIAVELKNNYGGATHLGGLLINSIKATKATILLIIDGVVASTAAFVWMWIHLAKDHGHFSNVNTIIKNNNANIVCHRPRNIKGENIGFIENTKSSEITDSFRKYVKEFDHCFVLLLQKYPLSKVRLITNTEDLLSIEEAWNFYSSNEDVVISIEGFDNTIN